MIVYNGAIDFFVSQSFIQTSGFSILVQDFDRDKGIGAVSYGLDQGLSIIAKVLTNFRDFKHSNDQIVFLLCFSLHKCKNALLSFASNSSQKQNVKKIYPNFYQNKEKVLEMFKTWRPLNGKSLHLAKANLSNQKGKP